MRPSTFSIAAHDAEKGDLGIAVESRFISVGSIVPHARARVGAVATQSLANVGYGPRGLDLLAQGRSPEEVITLLTADDEQREQRQVGVVDAKGRAASFTGKECFAWAGHRVGKNYACQGNILVSEAVVNDMTEAFEGAEGDLADRLLVALEAAQKAGGDKRGQQSAALLVVRERGGYGGFNDRYIDLRVDEHPAPIRELKRIFDLYDLIMLDRENPNDLLPIDSRTAKEMQDFLRRKGFYMGEVTGNYDEATRKSLEQYAGMENLENRVKREPVIHKGVLEYMRKQGMGTRGSKPRGRRP